MHQMGAVSWSRHGIPVSLSAQGVTPGYKTACLPAGPVDSVASSGSTPSANVEPRTLCKQSCKETVALQESENGAWSWTNRVLVRRVQWGLAVSALHERRSSPPPACG
ncbi:UNVERIFIED_CONTAM: hypothetical protein K2H54_001003 [Gekko kuhli]